MIIECPNCRSKYQYDEARFEQKPAKKIRCAKCQQIFEIHNPAMAKPAAAAAPRPAPAAVEVGDRTFASKSDPRGVTKEETTEQSLIPERQHDTGREVALQLPTGKRLSLAILDGPDAGTVVRIDKPRLTIGRAGADLTLNDGEASRLHASLEIRDSVYMLNDLGSTNGTLVNGSRIEEPMELADKSEFQIGSTTLMLIVTDDA